MAYTTDDMLPPYKTGDKICMHLSAVASLKNRIVVVEHCKKVVEHCKKSESSCNWLVIFENGKTILADRTRLATPLEQLL